MLDLLIKGGRVIDGAGNPWKEADVGVEAGHIAFVEPRLAALANRTIDATGLFVTPGFIDMHAHSDLQLLANPDHEAKVLQGVTLDVIGQDGLSYAPNNSRVLEILRIQLAGWNGNPESVSWTWRSVGEFLDQFDKGVAINVAYLVPHGTLRMLAVGTDDRAATQEELSAMKSLLSAALDDGAVGLSAGLTYAPGMYADDNELAELCASMSGRGFYCPHHRSYGKGAIEAYDSCIAIARRAHVPLHLAHTQLSFGVNIGRASELLDMIDDARRSGVDVTMDSYPYLAGATYLHSLLPRWMHDGGPNATLRFLQDPKTRARLRIAMEAGASEGLHFVPVDWTSVVVTNVVTSENSRFVGKSISAIAIDLRTNPFEVFCDILTQEKLSASCLVHNGDEDNVRAIIRHPAQMPASDGLLVGAKPHPRGWGTFPRFLGVYVRQLGLLTWEDAIRKMTALPAQRLGFLNRGLLRPGMVADITCFDPEAIIDCATYDEPRLKPNGIEYVIVNGVLVVDSRTHTGALPGRSIRSKQHLVPVD
jgi:N-acyl-D-amino-acid deacylase